MECYKIEQGTDDLEVWYSTEKIMCVKRKFDWIGRMKSSFIYNGNCILETTYNVFLFKKSLIIKDQQLPIVISLSRIGNTHYLECDGNILNVERHYVNNPVYTLYNNGQKIGEVTTKLGVFVLGPIIYNICFDIEEELNFYALILFLIELSPTTPG